MEKRWMKNIMLTFYQVTEKDNGNATFSLIGC